MVEKVNPDHFQKTEIEDISGSADWHFIHFVLIWCPSQRLPKYVDYIFCKIFEKEKYLSRYILLADQI